MGAALAGSRLLVVLQPEVPLLFSATAQQPVVERQAVLELEATVAVVVASETGSESANASCRVTDGRTGRTGSAGIAPSLPPPQVESEREARLPALVVEAVLLAVVAASDEIAEPVAALVLPVALTAAPSRLPRRRVAWPRVPLSRAPVVCARQRICRERTSFGHTC